MVLLCSNLLTEQVVEDRRLVKAIRYEDAKGFMQQLLRGLHFLHSNWILHRYVFWSGFWFPGIARRCVLVCSSSRVCWRMCLRGAAGSGLQMQNR